MTPSELEHYLHEQIPLSKAMDVSVVSTNADSLTLRAPLAPNVNHFESVFGGSASALAILAAWSLLNVCLRKEHVASRLVIQRNTMDYDTPIVGEFSAEACLDEESDWPRFLRTLARRGKARIKVQAELKNEGQIAGRFTGEFVALKVGDT